MPDADVLIVGAGPAGLAQAILLAGQGRAVTVLDARPIAHEDTDRRAFALAHGSRLTLDRLGAWPAHQTTAIHSIHVSQQGGLGRTLIEADELRVPALGHVAAAGILTTQLRERAQQAGVSLRPETTLCSYQTSADHVQVTLRQNDGPTQTLTPRLLIRADGTGGGNTGTYRRDYQQHALVATVTPRRGHGHRAFERFTRHGPIALLPFGTRDYALVHVLPPDKARTLQQQPDATYLAGLEQALGQRLELERIGPRESFALSLQYRRYPVGPRIAWIGNASQTLHPVAGQGFNLALRDAWTLAESLHDSDDPGAAQALQNYARQRRLDRLGTIGFTDTLIRVFSNDIAPLRHLRGAALGTLDTFAPLRRFLARRMMFGARAWP